MVINTAVHHSHSQPHLNAHRHPTPQHAQRGTDQTCGFFVTLFINTSSYSMPRNPLMSCNNQHPTSNTGPGRLRGNDKIYGRAGTKNGGLRHTHIKTYHSIPIPKRTLFPTLTTTPGRRPNGDVQHIGQVRRRRQGGQEEAAQNSRGQGERESGLFPIPDTQASVPLHHTHLVPP